MTTIKQVQKVLKYINKSSERFKYIHSNGASISCSDLETQITIYNNFGLSKGNYTTTTMLTGVKHDDVHTYRFNDALVFDCSVSVPVGSLADVYQYTSKDCTRLHLNGVHFGNDEMTATDGHRIKILELAGTSDNSYILPRESVRLLLRLCKLYKVESVDIKLGDSYAYVNTKHFNVRMRLINREYPRYQSIVPKRYKTTLKIVQAIRYKDNKSILEGDNCRINVSNGSVTLYNGVDTKTIGHCDVLEEFSFCINMKYLDVASQGLKEFEIKYNNEFSVINVNGALIMPMRV